MELHGLDAPRTGQPGRRRVLPLAGPVLSNHDVRQGRMIAVAFQAQQRLTEVSAWAGIATKQRVCLPRDDKVVVLAQ
jgi:hypothetical protein